MADICKTLDFESIEQFKTKVKHMFLEVGTNAGLIIVLPVSADFLTENIFIDVIMR